MSIQKISPKFIGLILITILFMTTSGNSVAKTATAKATSPQIAVPSPQIKSDLLCAIPYINYNQCISDCKDNRSECRDLVDDLVDDATDDLDNESERIAGLIADCVEECEEPVVYDGCDGFWDCLLYGGNEYSYSNPNCDSQCTEQYQSELDQLEDDYAALDDSAETLDDMCQNIYEICEDNCACDHLSNACPDPKTGIAPDCGTVATSPKKTPALIDFVGKNKFKIPSKTRKPLNNYKLNEELKLEFEKSYKAKTNTAPVLPTQTRTLKKK